jgi:hypothetical protein
VPLSLFVGERLILISLLYFEDEYSTSPVLSFRINNSSLGTCLKSNIWLIEFAMPSNEPCPMRSPPSQLSSMNRTVEL